MFLHEIESSSMRKKLAFEYVFKWDYPLAILLVFCTLLAQSSCVIQIEWKVYIENSMAKSCRRQLAMQS